MIGNLKTKHPGIYKYLFTVTTFSKLIAMFLFIMLPFVGFYIGIKYQEKTNVIPKVSVIATTSNNISNDTNIYKKDSERSNPEVCGYTASIKKKILEAQGISSTNNNFNYYLQNQGLYNGVWSNDCKKYIYSFHPQGAGWTAGPLPPMVGLWLYEPGKATSIKIINDFGDPDRWLTYNLVSIGSKLVIDVDLRKIISDEDVDSSWNPSKYNDWIMYRNTDFAWQFMHPKSWI